MKKNLGAKPYIYPQPVLIVASYGEDGTPNAMNVAYGGIDLSKFSPICYDPANSGYIKLGDRVGDAFKDGNKIK